MCQDVNHCVFCGIGLLSSCNNTFSCNQPLEGEPTPERAQRRLQPDGTALTEDEVAWTKEGSYILGKRLTTDDHAFLLRGSTPVYGRLGFVKNLATLEGEEEDAEDVENIQEISESPNPTTTRPGMRRTISTLSATSMSGRKTTKGAVSSQAVLRALLDNFPSMMWRQRNRDNEWETVAQTHMIRHGPVPIFPMHRQCYEGVFRPALAHITGGDLDDEVDRDVLYEVLSDMKNKDLLDFGVQNHERWVCDCESWPHCTEARPWFANPSVVPAGLTNYFENLPTTTTPRTSKKFANDAVSNVFSNLPAELNYQIMEKLDLPDVGAFRATSQAIGNLPLDGSFWRARVQSDMPWLYDFASPETSIRAIAAKPSHTGEEQAPIDWRRVYAELMSDLSRHPKKLTPDYQTQAPGLANRRRVWETCRSVAESYLIRA